MSSAEMDGIARVATCPGFQGPPPGAGAPMLSGSGSRWSIYLVTEVATGRGYVGLTSQELSARLTGHLTTALRRKRCRKGSLGEAILVTIARDARFEDSFTILELDAAPTAEHAQELERTWIARCGTAAPSGFNLMPGGSLGGPLNSFPVSVRHPKHGVVTYPSVSRAICATNRERWQARSTHLSASAVYARLELGWSIEEALELEPHVDGRAIRELPFTWNGEHHWTLQTVADRSGIQIDTLRSRLHRARASGSNADEDLSVDRRRRPSAAREPILLPAPDGSGLVDPRRYGEAVGVAKSSITHRWHQLVRSGRDPRTMPVAELHAWLIGRQDRRIVLCLDVAPGEPWTGGVRELIRRLFDHPEVECRRPSRFGASAIRARLRRAPGWPHAIKPIDIRWAFGFEAT